jgi:hypothetical protein
MTCEVSPDRSAGRLALGQQLAKLLLEQGVKAARRLIENQQLRPAHERKDEAHLSPVAGAELTDRPTRVQAEPLNQRSGLGVMAAAMQRAEIIDRGSSGHRSRQI